MSNWYEKSAEVQGLQAEAGMKENFMIAALALCIGGDATFLTNFLARRMGIERARLEQTVESYRPQAEKVIEDSEKSPEAMALVERAEDLVSEAEQQNAVEGSRTESDVVPMEVVDAVIMVEGADPKYIGPAGDTGLMQILPSTWEEINSRYFNGQFPYEQYALNAHMNRVFGRKYLEHINGWLRSKGADDEHLLFLTLAAYNGGMGRVQKCKFDPEVLRMQYPSVYDYARRALNLAEI